MTAICVIGTEVSARLQNVLILAQVASLLVFAGVALYRAVTGDSPLEALTPSITWLNPFAEGGAALTAGLLLGVFAYWGWESAVNLTEETDNSASTPGRAAIVSTVVLLVTYVVGGLRRGRLRRHRLPRRERGRGRADLRAARRAGARRLGLGPAARRGHLRARVHPDHDHPGLPDRAVDGPPARAAARAGAHPPALPHPGRVHLDGGRHRHRLVRAGQPDQRERAVRLDHRAVAADRLLLLADRDRLRGLLPQAADRAARTTCC